MTDEDIGGSYFSALEAPVYLQVHTYILST